MKGNRKKKQGEAGDGKILQQTAMHYARFSPRHVSAALHELFSRAVSDHIPPVASATILV